MPVPLRSTAFPDVLDPRFAVIFNDENAGYDTTLTHKEYASGLQIERKLFDDAQFGIIDDKPRGLAQAYARTRQKHAASIFNNAFSVDTTWQTGGDAVALCSDR